MWCSMTTRLTEDLHPNFWNLFIVYYHLVWGLEFCWSQTNLLRIHILCHHMQTSVVFFLAGLWVWIFVVKMKNNAYSIQKLWMGEWRCQLYVHYMFWCNQKHWEYVVLCCKNKSISDIAVLFVENKTSTELQAEASMWVRPLCWVSSGVTSFPVCRSHSWQLTVRMCYRGWVWGHTKTWYKCYQDGLFKSKICCKLPTANWSLKH